MPDNKARTQAFWTDLFNAHDLRLVQDYFAPGFVNLNARPGTPDGPEGARQVSTRLWASSSDMHFDLQAMVAENDTVVCIGLMSGTHDGPFHGIPATRRPTTARHIHVLTFDDDGLITEHLAVRDDVTVLGSSGRCRRPPPGPTRHLPPIGTLVTDLLGVHRAAPSSQPDTPATVAAVGGSFAHYRLGARSLGTGYRVKVSRRFASAAMSPVSTPDATPSITPASSRMSGAAPLALIAGWSITAGMCPAGLPAEPA